MTKRKNFERKEIWKAIVAIAVALAFVLPTSAAFANNETTGEVATSSSAESGSSVLGIMWDATLEFNEPGNGDASYDYVLFGEATDANDGPPDDIYDVMKPPPPPGPPYIRAWFDDGLDAPFTYLQKDYRHYPDTSKVWNLSVQWVPEAGETTDITISWDVNDIDASEYNDVVLYDVTGGNVVADMLVDTDYTFVAQQFYPDTAKLYRDFQIICSIINEPPGFSDENPSDGSVDVPITTSQLTVIMRDPEGDIFNWSIKTIPDIGSSNGVGESNGTKTCTVYGLDYDMTYTWYVNATDSGSGMWSMEIYTFTTESAPPEPDLDCHGRLNWTDVKPGSTVTGSFTVKNIGDPGSELDWEVIDWPDWGSGNIWTFVPSSGDDLASGDSVSVQVTVVAPDEKNQQFSGQIKIENSENSSDTCTIDVSLATPVSQNSVVLQFLERLIHHFPILERILSSLPFLGRILSLK